MKDFDFRLLNEFQHEFPLVPRPYAEIAARLGRNEPAVVAALARLRCTGAVSRIGAVLTPMRVGASTLAALAAPEGDIDRVAAIVSSHPEINHNYQRDHDLNLWFVANAGNSEELDAVLGCIEAETGCLVLRMPMLQEFHIDLGFDMAGRGRRRRDRCTPAPVVTGILTDTEKLLLRVMQDGIELLTRPFTRLAMRAGLAEAEVLHMIADLRTRGFIKRFGVVVRHRELGFAANAMCVWDIPDSAVADIGQCLGSEDRITLCYVRGRALPGWSFNLYCMIHGHSRGEVDTALNAICHRHGLSAYSSAVLFSVRRFKQCGARYPSASKELAHA